MHPPELVASIRARLQRSAARLQAAADRKAKPVTKPVATPPPKKKGKGWHTSAFERSPEWRALSAEARRLQPWCTKCLAVDQLQADHIKPKSRFPHLALDPANIQVLCWPCNRTKAARIEA